MWFLLRAPFSGCGEKGNQNESQKVGGPSPDFSPTPPRDVRAWGHLAMSERNAAGPYWPSNAAWTGCEGRADGKRNSRGTFPILSSNPSF